MAAGGLTFNLARDSLQAHEPLTGLTRFRRRGYHRYRQVHARYGPGLPVEAALVHHHHDRRFRADGSADAAWLDASGQIVLVMSLMATMLFITEAIPLPTVPLLIIVGEVVLLKVDPTDVARA